MLTITLSEFRSNMSEYMNKVSKGTRVLVRDGKKKISIAEITPVSHFDKNAYEKNLRKAAGTFSSQRHPEWKSAKDISEWLRKSRLVDERVF